MKSLFLSGLSSTATLIETLRTLLPGQESPWLLLSESGDPIAYFSVGSILDGEPNIHVQADLSGRHFNGDEPVRKILKMLQSAIGGTVEDDV